MKEFLIIYFPIYFLAALMIIPYAFKTDILERRSGAYDTTLLLILALVLIVLFGFRDYEIGTDTLHYVKAFNQIQFSQNLQEAINTRTAFSSKDPFFNLFTYYIGSVFGLRGYFVVLSILYVVPIIISVFLLTKTHRSLMFLCFMGLIAFPNMGINIVRSAVSLSLGLLALTLFLRDFNRMGVFFMFFSLSFHLSSLLIFVAAATTLFRIPIQYYVVGLSLCTALAVGGINLTKLPTVGELIMAQDRLSGYISGDRVVGALSPFVVLFYFLPLFLGLFCHFKLKDMKYEIALKVFITLTGFYFLTLGLNDSYRFGFIASIFVPVIICYPTLNYRFAKGVNFIPVALVVLFVGILAYYRTA